MRHRRFLSALLLATIPAIPLHGSQSATQGEADPGVRPTRLIDRAEVRVSRVELQPGAVRRVHSHTDVQFHLWVPLTGELQLTKGTEPPVAAPAGQAFFFPRNSPHGFKNVGTTAATVLEVFIKDSNLAFSPALAEALAREFAALDLAPAAR